MEAMGHQNVLETMAMNDQINLEEENLIQSIDDNIHSSESLRQVFSNPLFESHDQVHGNEGNISLLLNLKVVTLFITICVIFLFHYPKELIRRFFQVLNRWREIIIPDYFKYIGITSFSWACISTLISSLYISVYDYIRIAWYTFADLARRTLIGITSRASYRTFYAHPSNGIGEQNGLSGKRIANLMPELEDDTPDQVRESLIEGRNTLKYTRQLHAHSDSLEELEPAFLNEKDYPSGWMVYHPAVGVVSKSVADNLNKSKRIRDAVDKSVVFPVKTQNEPYDNPEMEDVTVTPMEPTASFSMTNTQNGSDKNRMLDTYKPKMKSKSGHNQSNTINSCNNMQSFRTIVAT